MAPWHGWCCMIAFLSCLNFALRILRPILRLCLSLPTLVPQGYSALFVTCSILSGESKELITMMKARGYSSEKPQVWSPYACIGTWSFHLWPIDPVPCRTSSGLFQLTHMSRDDPTVQLIEPWQPKRRQNIITRRQNITTAVTMLPQGWVSAPKHQCKTAIPTFVDFSWELHWWWQLDRALERWLTMERQKGS